MTARDIFLQWGGLFLLTVIYHLLVVNTAALTDSHELLEFLISVFGLFLIPTVLGLIMAGLYYAWARAWPPWHFLVTAMLWGGLTAIHYLGVTHGNSQRAAAAIQCCGGFG